MPNAIESHPESEISSPLARLRAIRAYANRVFDDEARAATWLSRAHETIGGGLCAVGAACQETEGYREAMAELGRLERQLQHHGYYVHQQSGSAPARQSALHTAR